MKYYWPLFEIIEICLSDVSHLGVIALAKPAIFTSANNSIDK
jgi:hypothetical protein